MKSGYIFAPEHWHNHASCIVELPDGDLLACWYHGSGERTADDVLIEGSRWSIKSHSWSTRFLMADVRDYPDCNPCMFVNTDGTLWLIYVTILANEWHTALLRSQTSICTGGDACPKWNWADVIHVTPNNKFITDVLETDYSTFPCFNSGLLNGWVDDYFEKQNSMLNNKLFRRIGWMPRAHPVVIGGNRIILPLYSDGFDFSIMLISDDNGQRWHTSSPIVSPGGVQPSVVERADGVLVAFMRNNGPAPHCIMKSVSNDRGESWSTPVYTTLPNPGSGIEAIKLHNGQWLMVYNDTEIGRYRLGIAVSEDEGETWTFRRYLEDDDDKEPQGHYSYPSIIQTDSGDIWMTYTSQVPNAGNTIKWAQFDSELT
jgi:predicted neuraminidase